jgi:hypothetical protein
VAGVLGDIGRSDVVLELFDDQPGIVAHALIAMGRFDEVLERFPDNLGERGEALYHLGRLDEVIAGAYPPHLRRKATLLRYGAARLEADFPGDVEALFLIHRGAEAAANAPNTMVRARALLDGGRFEEALAIAPATWVKVSALLQLGRYAEALELSGHDLVLGYDCAWYLIPHGEERRGRELLARLATVRVAPLDEEAVPFLRFILPCLLAARDGASVDPAESLREVLDQRRSLAQQRTWHEAAYLAGRITDEQFLAQPARLGAQARLLAVQGMKRELAHDWTGALAAYRACRAIDADGYLLESTTMRGYIGWRAAELESRGH